MSSDQNITKRGRAAQPPFDEDAYTQALIKAGMPAEDARSLARRTAEARKVSEVASRSASDILGTPSMTADQGEAEDDQPDEVEADQDSAGDTPAGSGPRLSARQERRKAMMTKEKPIAAVFDYRNG